MNNNDLIRYFQHEIEVLGAPSPKYCLPTTRLAQSQGIEVSINSALERGRLSESEAEGLLYLNKQNIENFRRQVNN